MTKRQPLAKLSDGLCTCEQVESMQSGYRFIGKSNLIINPHLLQSLCCNSLLKPDENKSWKDNDLINILLAKLLRISALMNGEQEPEKKPGSSRH
ncbi:hypothetical protein GRJ2_002133900 [Grus japonensis]|uniref:Uncharacterized protein n=1 Tax=Grus japonensis TaxID=30415 RepID=A0ABC9XH72_GRUJA